MRWSPEERSRLAEAAREFARLELASQTAEDTVLLNAGRLQEVADRVSLDPRRAHAEMGDAAFYDVVGRVAAVASGVGLMHLLRTLKEQAELGAAGVPALGHDDDGGP
ncbi:MAG: hypothetical protein U0797_30330 [Gemmataceae bacterium]